MNSMNRPIVASPFAKGRQHQLKFQSILSEAAQLFNWQGSRATTLADIAGSMKLTKTCLYYYVKTKEELIYQCYVASCAMWLERAQSSAQIEGTGLDKIVAMVRGHFYHYADTLNGKGQHFAMLTEVSSLEQPHIDDITARWAEVFGLCRSMVAQGIKDRSIAMLDAAVVTLAIFSILQWLPVWFNRKHAANADQVIETVLDILVNGLAVQRHPFAAIEFPSLQELPIDSFDRDVQNRLKREAFCRVGSIYFNQKGYKGTSLDEIASSLDVTKGAFYYHIKDKEELLYQCFKRTLDVEKLLLNKAGEAGGTGINKVELALRYLFNVQFSADGPLIRYRSLPSLDEGHRKSVLKANTDNSAQLGAYIRQGFADNTVRKIEADIAQYVLSGAVEASPDLIDWVENSHEVELSAVYFHLFINGLKAK